MLQMKISKFGPSKEQPSGWMPIAKKGRIGKQKLRGGGDRKQKEATEEEWGKGCPSPHSRGFPGNLFRGFWPLRPKGNKTGRPVISTKDREGVGFKCIESDTALFCDQGRKKGSAAEVI